jgi:hypothetical protein
MESSSDSGWQVVHPQQRRGRLLRIAMTPGLPDCQTAGLPERAMGERHLNMFQSFCFLTARLPAP